MWKNLASKGRPAEKIWCVKGGGVTSICYNANISARRPKIAFLRFWKFKFSRGRRPPDPLTLYSQRQLYPTNCFITKYSQGNVNSFLASAGLILKQLITVSKIMLSTGMNFLFMYFRIRHLLLQDLSVNWLTVYLSFVSFRFTLPLFLVFSLFWGGCHLKYLGLQGGAGKKFLT